MAARGLDVKHLILVVNYDCPNHYEDYVHRCGRTGRAGNKGFAYTFISPDQQRPAGDIIKALDLTGTPVPPELQEMWDKFKAKMAAVIENLIFVGVSYCTVCNGTLFVYRKGKPFGPEAVASLEKDSSLTNRKPWPCRKKRNSKKPL